MKNKCSVYKHRNEKWHILKGTGKVFVEDIEFECKGSYFEIKKAKFIALKIQAKKTWK